METKNDKFTRLARARLDKVRYHMSLIGNLSRPAYEYNRSDIEWMRGELNELFDIVLAMFDNPVGE